MNIRFCIFFLAIIAMPGIYIRGSLITITDLLIPCLGIYAMGTTIRLNRTQIFYSFYILAILLSILVALLYNGSVDISIVLKALRSAFLLFLFPIVYKYMKKRKFEMDSFCFWIMISGCISALTGIFLFVFQSPLYRAPQTMIILTKILFRAGGVFAEAGTFSLMMSLILIFSIECFMGRIHPRLAVVSILLSVVGIIVSDTRIAFMAVVATILYALFRERKINWRQVGIFAVIIIVGILILRQNSFVQRFMNERVLSTIAGIFLRNANMNRLSSGRIFVWQTRISDYLHSGILRILFGNGYKIGETGISDNNYIFALYSMGILGLISLLGYWISNIRQLRRTRKNQDFIYKIYRDMILIFLIYMITCDAMTMSRPMYLFATVASVHYCLSKERSGK